MTESEPTVPAYQKTSDYFYADKPLYWQRGVFRIRVYEKRGEVPIVVAGPPTTESKYLVADVTPYLSADILGKHFSARLWEQEPMRWIEEVVRLRRRRGTTAAEWEYWLVSFASFQPKRAKVWGHEVSLLIENSRRPIRAKEITKLLGQDWNAASEVNSPQPHGLAT